MRTATLCILLMLAYCSTNAQDDVRMWKKHVVRTIDIRTAGTTKDGNAIGALMFAALKENRLSFFESFYYDSTRLPAWVYKELVSKDPDTNYDYKPNNHRDTILRKRNNFQPDSVYAFNIYEDWIYNPLTDKIEIQVKYIDPLTPMYIGDKFWYLKKNFRISFTDFYGLLAGNEALLRTFSSSLWQSYFVPGAKGTMLDPARYVYGAEWCTDAIAETEIKVMEDTVKHSLQADDQQPSLTQLIVDGIEAGVTDAWLGDYRHGVHKPFSTLATRHEISDITSPTDTTVHTDSFSQMETITITHHDIDYTNLMRYKILQRWSFDPMEEKTEISLVGIAPRIDTYDDTGGKTGTKTMFWVHYNDVLPYVKQSDVYYPEYSLPLQIWQHFFLSENKPVIEW